MKGDLITEADRLNIVQMSFMDLDNNPYGQYDQRAPKGSPQRIHGTKYHYPYTKDMNFINWCSYRIERLYDVAGCPWWDTIQQVYLIASVGKLYRAIMSGQMEAFGQWYSPGSVPPLASVQICDLNENGMPDHVRLVISVDEEVGHYYTHEGNYAGTTHADYWHINPAKLRHPDQILGFFSPTRKGAWKGAR